MCPIQSIPLLVVFAQIFLEFGHARNLILNQEFDTKSQVHSKIAEPKPALEQTTSQRVNSDKSINKSGIRPKFERQKSLTHEGHHLGRQNLGFRRQIVRAKTLNFRISKLSKVLRTHRLRDAAMNDEDGTGINLSELSSFRIASLRRRPTVSPKPISIAEIKVATLSSPSSSLVQTTSKVPNKPSQPATTNTANAPSSTINMALDETNDMISTHTTKSTQSSESLKHTTLLKANVSDSEE